MTNFCRILLISLFVFAASLTTLAQSSELPALGGRGNSEKDEPYPTTITENLAKMRIKAARKEFDELVQRIEETKVISDELDRSYETTQNLNPVDAKKIERLEKLLKKIRSQIGAESDNDDENEFAASNAPVGSVIKNIKDDAKQLLSEIKKTGRFAISVVAIESSNSMLKLVRFIKQKTRGK